MKKLHLLLLIFFGLPAYAEDYKPTPIDNIEMTCFEREVPIKWSFCINQYIGSSNRDLIYYFHGKDGAAAGWNDQAFHSGRLYEIWKKNGEAPPLVVSISFGKIWLLTENENEVGGGLHNIFKAHVLPEIEKQLQHPVDKRMLAGISMGGLNTLILSMKIKKFYTKAAAICPPISKVSPHSGLWNIFNYFRKSSTSIKRAIMLWMFSKKFYPTQKIWEANDPLFLSQSFEKEGAPEIYLTCGAKDDWGCMEGSKSLVKNIKKAKGQITWVPRAGGHCDIEYESFAHFLTQK